MLLPFVAVVLFDGLDDPVLDDPAPVEVVAGLDDPVPDDGVVDELDPLVPEAVDADEDDGVVVFDDVCEPEGDALAGEDVCGEPALLL